MQTLTIGEQDFRKLRDSNAYYVDKSDLIAGILDKNLRGTFLFTRPRKFGKSLNLSMIDAFLNIEYAGIDEHWFDGLSIRNHPRYGEFRSKFPVIHLDFRGIFEDGSKDVHLGIADMNRELYTHFSYLLDSERIDGNDKELFERFRNGDYERLSIFYPLRLLVNLLSEHYGSEVVILIDDYDIPMVGGYGKPGEDIPGTALQNLLGPLLKGCSSVKAAVFTGVSLLFRERLLDRLNNLRPDCILSVDNGGMFGFTDEEVRRICSDYGHPEKYEEAKAWYGGYRFGNSEIYNPRSVLRYVESGFVPGPYWTTDIENPVLDYILRDPGYGVLESITGLLTGKPVYDVIDPAIAYKGGMVNGHHAYSLLAVEGYLCPQLYGERLSVLSIPNLEVREMIETKIEKHHLPAEVIRRLSKS